MPSDPAPFVLIAFQAGISGATVIAADNAVSRLSGSHVPRGLTA